MQSATLDIVKIAQLHSLCISKYALVINFMGENFSALISSIVIAGVKDDVFLYSNIDEKWDEKEKVHTITLLNEELDDFVCELTHFCNLRGEYAENYVLRGYPAKQICSGEDTEQLFSILTNCFEYTNSFSRLERIKILLREIQKNTQMLWKLDGRKEIIKCPT